MADDSPRKQKAEAALIMKRDPPPKPPKAPERDLVTRTDRPGVDRRGTPSIDRLIDESSGGIERFSPGDIASQTRGPLSTAEDFGKDIRHQYDSRAKRIADFETKVNSPMWQTGKTVTRAKSAKGRR